MVAMFARSAYSGVLLAALLACAGCLNPPAPTMRQAEVGLIYVFPGVEGGAWSMQWAYQGYRDAGVTAEIRTFDWQRASGMLVNLMDYEGNRERADKVAAELAAFRADHATAAIDLVGYSGGGGVAVMVLEALPPKVHVRNVVLAQPALSPTYDLTKALKHVDGRLVNFFCTTDWFILGAGTEAFGTIDRVNVASAGKEGFFLTRAVRDEKLREKVVQRCWTSQMMETGHFGNHIGILMYGWNKQYVAPYVLPTTRNGVRTPAPARL